MFERVLAFLAEAFLKGDAFVLMTPPYSVEFTFPDRAARTSWLSQAGISPQEFAKQSERVAWLLHALLNGIDAEGLANRLSRHEKGEPDTATVEDYQRDMDFVRARVYTDRLQNRWDLKQSSKAPSFSAIDWDVKVKVADADREVASIPYATVRLRFQRDFGHDPYALFGGRAFDSVQVNFSPDEIEYVRNVLSRALESLESECERLGLTRTATT